MRLAETIFPYSLHKKFVIARARSVRAGLALAPGRPPQTDLAIDVNRPGSVSVIHYQSPLPICVIRVVLGLNSLRISSLRKTSLGEDAPRLFTTVQIIP